MTVRLSDWVKASSKTAAINTARSKGKRLQALLRQALKGINKRVL